MRTLNALLDRLRSIVRAGARHLAKELDGLSGGRLTPTTVTFVSLAGHIPIAYLIAVGYVRWAALFLVVFGLLDTLDGELARLQKRAGPAGMLLDASTDRMKESLLYIASAYAFVRLDQPYMAVWAVAACAGALLVSYVKAKGETAVSGHGRHDTVNRLFQDGLMRYEVRMGILVIGLIFGWLAAAIILIALLSWITAFGRLHRITKHLDNAAR